MVCLAFHPFLSVILNGFVTHFFRYTFVVMPFLALCVANILDKIVGRKLTFGVPQVFICAILSAGIMASTILGADSGSIVGKPIGYLTLMLMLAMSMLAVIMQNMHITPRGKKAAVACMVIVLAINVTAESYLTTNARRPISMTTDRIYQTTGNDDVHSALKFISQHDSSFHRTEKMFQDIAYLNDSMLEGYYGISVYNSTVNADIIAFVEQCAPAMKALPADGYYDFRPMYSDVDRVSLLGVKYILSQTPITDVPEYSYLTAFGDVYLYENTAASGVAQFFTKAISYEEFTNLDADGRNAVIGDTLILDASEIEKIQAGQDASAICNFEKPTNSSYIHGTVETDADGWLFLSVPNEKGWTAYVDGCEAEILKADYAFCAIAVGAGSHEVELRYETPLLKEGVVISCVGLAMFAAMCVYLILKEKRGR